MAVLMLSSRQTIERANKRNFTSLCQCVDVSARTSSRSGEHGPSTLSKAESGGERTFLQHQGPFVSHCNPPSFDCSVIPRDRSGMSPSIFLCFERLLLPSESIQMRQATGAGARAASRRQSKERTGWDVRAARKKCMQHVADEKEKTLFWLFSLAFLSTFLGQRSLRDERRVECAPTCASFGSHHGSGRSEPHQPSSLCPRPCPPKGNVHARTTCLGR